MRKMKRSAKKSISILLICVFGLTGFLKVRAADAGVYLLKAEGSVSVQSGSGKDMERYASMELPGGSRVKTGSDSRARIGVGREGELCLESCGALEMRTQGAVPEFLLERGMLFFELREKDAPLNIRTAETALTAETAEGWVRVVDGQRTLICLEEGRIRCSVTDPVSGQVKTVRLREGQTAECIVRLPSEEGDRCEISVRALEETDRELPACSGREAADAARDPVWTHTPGTEFAETEEAEPVEEEENGRAGTGRTPSPGAALSSRPRTPAVPPAPAVPFSGGVPVEEVQTASSSGGSGHSGSGSSSPSQPSQPAATTQDQGLVLKGIVANEGTILVEESGKVTMAADASAAGQLMNYGTIVNQGTIDGTVVNGAGSGGSFTMEGGSITRVANEAVTRSVRAQDKPEILISGGTVEEGVRVESGNFTMQGGTVKAPEGTSGSALLLDGGATASIQGGIIENRHGGAAITAKNGEISVKEGAAVRAGEPLKTLNLSDAGTVTVEYRTKEDVRFRAAYTGADGLPAFYVTSRKADGLTELRILDGGLEQAVQAVNGGKGDTITLAGNVACRGSGVLKAQGGTASAPVLLDLGGRTLTLSSDNYREFVLTGGSAWEIRGREKAGKLILDNTAVTVSENSTFRITDATVEAAGGEIAAGPGWTPEGNNNIVISGSSVSGAAVRHSTGGRLEISDSTIKCQGVSDMEKTYGQLQVRGAVIEGSVAMSDAVTDISDSVIKGSLENGGGRLTAVNSDVEAGPGVSPLYNSYGQVTMSAVRMTGYIVVNEHGTMTLSNGTAVPGIDNLYGCNVEIRDCRVTGDIINLNDSGPDSAMPPCRMKIFNSTITGSLVCNVGPNRSLESVIEVFGSTVTDGKIESCPSGSLITLSGSEVTGDSMNAESGGEIRILDKSRVGIKNAMNVRNGTVLLSDSEAVLESALLLIDGGGQMDVEKGSRISVPEIAVRSGGQLTVSDSEAVVETGGVSLFHNVTRAAANGSSALLLNPGAVMTIQEGTGRLEDASERNTISIDGARVNGRIVAAFKLELKGGADIHADGTDPAVLFDMDKSPRGMNLSDCRITNEGAGAGLRVISSSGSLSWLYNLLDTTRENIRTKAGNPIEIGTAGSGYDLPSGYEIEERDGYQYLMKSPSGASVRSADAGSEPEASEPEVSEPETSEPETSEPEVSEPESPDPEDDAVAPKDSGEENDGAGSPEEDEDASDQTEGIQGAI